MPDNSMGPCSRLRELRQKRINYWSSYWSARTSEREFLDGDRYERDSNYQWVLRGQETSDTIRHFVAETTKKTFALKALARDSTATPLDKEIAISLIERDWSDPDQNFKRAFYETVVDSREARIGIMWIDWDPDLKLRFFRWLDMNKCWWDESYHPHHPKCRFFCEEKRVDVDEANETYGVDYLKPDREAFTPQGSYDPSVPVVLDGSGQRLPNSGCLDDNKVTLWFCWYKRDPYYKKPKRGYEDQAPLADPHMVCAPGADGSGGCGYRSPDHAELLAEGEVEPLPQILPGGCPICGGDLHRVDAEDKSAQQQEAEDRKKLLIMAPYCPDPSDSERPLYYDKWPIASARSFPGLFLTSYVKPGKPMGPSDVTLMQDRQVAKDRLDMLAVRRVFEHRSFWEMPREGIFNYRGKRFDPSRDDHGSTMYRDATKARFGPLTVTVHNGVGLDPNWSIVEDRINQSLVSRTGVTDLGLTEQNIKGVAVGTVERAVQQGLINIEDYDRRKADELSIFAGVNYDYICATITPEDLQRLQIEGVDVHGYLRGDALPGMDFIVQDKPEFSGLEEARASTLSTLWDVVERATNDGYDPLMAVDLFAESTDAPPSIVTNFKKMLQAALDKAEEEANAMHEVGMNPLDASQTQMDQSGLNGAGMEPAPVA